MPTFLQELAQKLLKDHNHDLSQLVVMFPSQRAKTGYDAKLGDGLQIGDEKEQNEIAQLKADITNGPSDEELINSF